MTQAIVAHLLEQAELSVAELAGGCHAETSWVLARAREVLTDAPLPPDPAQWRFSGEDLLRLRRIRALERDFDAVPELAALVTDLVEELDRLRARLRSAGLPID